MNEPPPLVQEEVEMQTPGALPAPVQGPFTDARGDRAPTRLVESKKVSNAELRSCILVAGFPKRFKECVQMTGY